MVKENKIELTDKSPIDLLISKPLYNYIVANINYINYKVEQGNFVVNSEKQLKSKSDYSLKGVNNMLMMSAIIPDEIEHGSGGGYVPVIFEEATDWYKIYEENGFTIYEYTNTTYKYSQGYEWVANPYVGEFMDNYYIYNGGNNKDAYPIKTPNDDIFDELDDYPCASKILAKLLNFDSVISNMVKDVFDFDISMNVTFEVDEKLSGTSTDATASQNSDIDFIIRMNPDVLNNATQEYIAVTFAHEVIHSLISYYWQNNPDLAKKYFPIFVDYRDSNTGFLEPPTKDMRDYELNKQHHETMANKYINAMKEMVLKLNSSFPEKNAIYLAWGGLQGTWAYELKKMASLNDSNGNNIWEGKVSSANQQERNSSATSKGTKCIN